MPPATYSPDNGNATSAPPARHLGQVSPPVLFQVIALNRSKRHSLVQSILCVCVCTVYVCVCVYSIEQAISLCNPLLLPDSFRRLAADCEQNLGQPDGLPRLGPRRRQRHLQLVVPLQSTKLKEMFMEYQQNVKNYNVEDNIKHKNLHPLKRPHTRFVFLYLGYLQARFFNVNYDLNKVQISHTISNSLSVVISCKVFIV